MSLHDTDYNELSYYTLSYGDPDFIHQHSVDAHIAQTANEQTKPIALTFALIGLYLYLEKGFTGKQVQKAHTYLAQVNQTWTHIQLPQTRGTITPSDVLKRKPGEERDTMIKQWCEEVWQSYKAEHKIIKDLTNSLL